MPQALVYQVPGRAVAVVTPAPGVDASQLTAAVVPAGATHAVIDTDDLPADNTYRDAWKLDGGRIAVDPTLAEAVDAIQSQALIDHIDAAWAELDAAPIEVGGRTWKATAADQDRYLRVKSMFAMVEAQAKALGYPGVYFELADGTDHHTSEADLDALIAAAAARQVTLYRLAVEAKRAISAGQQPSAEAIATFNIPA